jgi:serine protease SohB
MDSFIQIGVFFAQTLIIVVGFIAVILTIAAVSIRAKSDKAPDISDLNEKYKEQKQALLSVMLSDDDLKKEKKKQKKEEKNKPTKTADLKKLFVVDFLKGDIQASHVDRFREEITSVLAVAKPGDDVLINVESPGGIVHGYGLAAAQILRLRDFGLNITVSVDKIAASGGYMMACVAHKIIGSPFAIVGSIGVVAQLPNFHRLLKKNDVDYKEYTAGEFKRTVGLFTEITDKGERKFIEQLESTHVLFKNFVSKFRPHLKMEEIATGEYWFGQQALEKGLIDEIKTSDEFIQNQLNHMQVYKICFEKKPSLSQKLSGMVDSAVNAAVRAAVGTGFSSQNFTTSGLTLQKQFSDLSDASKHQAKGAAPEFSMASTEIIGLDQTLNFENGT